MVKQEKRAQRKASSAVLREVEPRSLPRASYAKPGTDLAQWARVAVGEVDQEAYEVSQPCSYA